MFAIAEEQPDEDPADDPKTDEEAKEDEIEEPDFEVSDTENPVSIRVQCGTCPELVDGPLSAKSYPKIEMASEKLPFGRVPWQGPQDVQSHLIPRMEGYQYQYPLNSESFTTVTRVVDATRPGRPRL